MPNYTTVYIGEKYTLEVKSWSFLQNLQQSDIDNVIWEKEVDDIVIEIGKGAMLTQNFKRDEQGKKVVFKVYDKTRKSCCTIPVYVAKDDIAITWEDTNGNMIEEIPYGGVAVCHIHLKNTFPTPDLNLSYKILVSTNNLKEEIIEGCVEINERHGRIKVSIDPKLRNKGSLTELYDLTLSVEISDAKTIFSNSIYFDSNNICTEKITIKDFYVDKEGFVINPRVEKVETEIYSQDFKYISFKNKKNVNALVLHRTDNYCGSQTLNAAETLKQGGHFTVDSNPLYYKNIPNLPSPRKELSGTDGAIYQFASLLHPINHVGPFRSRPEIIEGIPKNNWGSNTKDKRKERNKEYGYTAGENRFPFNKDSIGIEVVGKCEKSWDTGWEGYWYKVSEKQAENVAWLTKGILEYFELDKNNDLYVHEQISSKTWGEGGTVLLAIKSFMGKLEHILFNVYRNYKGIEYYDPIDKQKKSMNL